MKKLIVAALLVLFIGSASAQILTPVKWSYASKKLSAGEGVLFIKATIDERWHIYSQTVKPGGPVRTSFVFKPDKAYQISGPTMEPTPVTEYEKVFEMPVSYFSNSVIFQQRVKLKRKGPVKVKGILRFMTCNNEKCLPPDEVAFEITIQ